MAKVYVYQDGADFYRDEEAPNDVLLWTAPYVVKDSDLSAAERARADFIEYAKVVLEIEVVF